MESAAQIRVVCIAKLAENFNERRHLSNARTQREAQKPTREIVLSKCDVTGAWERKEDDWRGERSKYRKADLNYVTKMGIFKIFVVCNGLHK